MILDKGAEKFIEKQQSVVVEDRLMTPDGLFYIQLVGDNEVVYVPKDHPLMLMTDEQFSKSLDDSYYNWLAEVLYEQRRTVVN